MKYYFTYDDKEKRCELCNQKLINDKHGRLDLCGICYTEYNTKESNLSISDWIKLNRLCNKLPFLSFLFKWLFYKKYQDDEFIIKIMIIYPILIFIYSSFISSIFYFMIYLIK